MDEPRRRRRRRATSDDDQGPLLSDRTLLVGVVVMTVGSMLLVGAVHVPVILSLGLLAVPLAGVALLGLRRERSFPHGNPVWAFIGLSAFCVLQALPLPNSLSARLAPQTQAVWEDCLRPFGEAGPSWHALSLDAGATWIEACKWFTYAAVFAAALLLAARGRAVLIWLTLFGSAALAALVSAAHLAFGATRLYGIYEPQFAVSPWHVAPLLNPNNLSGYLLLGVFAGFAVLFARRPPVPRPVLVVALAGLLGVLILTGSRGGVAAFALGLLLFLAFLLIGRRSGPLVPTLPRWAASAAVAAVGLTGIAFAALAASDQTRIALQDESFSKLSVISWTLGLMKDNWLVGVGRGAFETAFPPYRAGLGRMLFQYPENFVVQWFSEWGIVVSLLAGAWLLKTLRPWRYFSGQTSNAALAVGVVALLAQNLVDLGLEVMSVGIAFSAALGALTGDVSSRSNDGGRSEGSNTALPGGSSGSLWSLHNAWLLGPLLLAVVANGMGWAKGQHSAVADRTSLRALYTDLRHDVSKAASFRGELREAMLRHPGDAYLPLLGALAATRSGQDPITWINRALERDPERGATHFVLAGVLIARGSVGQGMLALRFAVARQPEFLHRAAVLVQTRARRAQDVWASVPEGPAGIPMLLALGSAAERATSAIVSRAELIDEAVRREPHSEPARLAEVRGLLLDLKEKRPRCLAEQRASCFAAMDRALHVLETDEKVPTPEIVLAAAQRRALDGRLADADSYLAEHCPELSAPTSCLKERVLYAIQSGSVKASTDAATAYLAAACDSAVACAKASTWVGDRLQEHGDTMGAIDYYSRAAKDKPEPAIWRKLANATKATGQLQRSHEATERAEQAHDGPAP